MSYDSASTHLLAKTMSKKATLFSATGGEHDSITRNTHSLLISTDQNTSKGFLYHIKTVWLFTFSDLKTIVFPSTAFGVLNTIAISLQRTPTASNLHFKILSRTPIVFLWTWINLLPFAINNQRQPYAILEDSLNKPWRSMPSGRLSPTSAKKLMLVTYALAILASTALMTLSQCIVLIMLGFWYNNRNGADAGFVVRNLINAGGFVCFISGAMQAALFGEPVRQSALQLLGWWYGVIAGIVFSTVQLQDMYDQRGDALRKRKTMPLVLGDGVARWSIAVPMAIWCWLTPLFWGLPLLGYVVPVLLGLTVAVRTFNVRSESGDRRTFLLWNIWMVSNYSLPLIKSCEGSALLSS